MKQSIALQFLLLFHFAYAGTGGANDIEEVYLLIIGVLAVPLAVFILIGLIRKMLTRRRDKLDASADETHNEAHLPEQ